jgi:hypothetical protein
MYYLEKLFMPDGKPKYFSRRFYPVDATELAQSVLTLTRFGYIDRAINVLNYALESLYSGKGFFYYQKNRFFTHKTSYMRWSNAYFFNAIACLAYSVVVKSKYLCF